MRKIIIEEAKNGYVVRLAKIGVGDIIESGVIVCHTIAGVQEAIEGHFISKAPRAGYKD